MTSSNPTHSYSGKKRGVDAPDRKLGVNDLLQFHVRTGDPDNGRAVVVRCCGIRQPTLSGQRGVKRLTCFRHVIEGDGILRSRQVEAIQPLRKRRAGRGALQQGGHHRLRVVR